MPCASPSEREQLIEVFAGELLLPTRDLAGRAAEQTADPRALLIQIAAEYRLSWSAAVDRARRTGLVDADEAQRLRARAPVRGDFLALLAGSRNRIFRWVITVRYGCERCYVPTTTASLPETVRLSYSAPR